jgi:hypothetical protein
MRFFLPALSLLLLVACGGDEGAGFEAHISSPQSGATFTEMQTTLFEGVVSDGVNPLGAIEVSWWAGQRLLCKWKKLDEGGLSNCETMLRQGEEEVVFLARDPGLAGLPDVETFDSITVTVLAEKDAPICSFISPSGDWGMEPEDQIDIRAKIRVPNDAQVSGELVQWKSDVDGALGESQVDQGGVAEFELTGLSAGSHEFSMVFASVEFGSCQASIQLGVGPAPIVEILSPTSPSTIEEGKFFEASATVSHSESVRFTWSSDLDGDLKTRTIRAGGQSNLRVQSLSAGVHQITATAQDSLGVPGQDTVEVEVYGIPTAPVIRLEPDPIFAGSDLELVLVKESVDPDGGVITHRIEWLVDGQPHSQDSKIVPGSAIASGEVWQVLVWGETSTQKGHVAQASITVGGFVGWGDQANPFSVADSQIRGEQEKDLSGTALSMGCDLDGDGLDDLLVGAPKNDEGGSNAGRTFVVRGSEMSTSSQVDAYYLKESLVGEMAGDLSGSALACRGDVDGDGVLDILVGAPGRDRSRGYVHLVMGDDFSGDFDLIDSNYVLEGENQGDLSGTVVDFAGDVDGDGLSDVLVGAWANSKSGVFSGKVYLVTASSFGADTFVSLADAGASWMGESTGHRAGHSVSGSMMWALAPMVSMMAALPPTWARCMWPCRVEAWRQTNRPPWLISLCMARNPNIMLATICRAMVMLTVTAWTIF